MKSTGAFRQGARALLGILALSLGQYAAAATHAKAGPWQYMIRGNSAPLLRGWARPGLPHGWHVRHGVLSKSGPVEDLESTGTYRDFDLEWQWKIGEASNSGIFYRATHADSHIYLTGLEYQLVDDAHTQDGKSRMTAAGSVFAIYPCPAGIVHPYGHWNMSRIVVRGTHVEYWLNGRKTISYVVGSPDWQHRVAASVFAPHPHYGREPVGMIGIQGDHPGSVWIRDMRVRVLP